MMYLRGEITAQVVVLNIFYGDIMVELQLANCSQFTHLILMVPVGAEWECEVGATNPFVIIPGLSPNLFTFL